VTAPLHHQEIRLDPVEVFIARAEARAHLFGYGMLDLHEAVDVLQADGEASGLVNQIGQDAVQSILSAAFAAGRIDPPKEGADPIEDGAVDIATSTLQAAEFLVREKDPARLRAWLDKHTAEECAAILRHLERREEARVK
jgi:hypothetical protein